MAEKIGLVLTLLFALFLKLCFDKNTQQAVAQFIEWFSYIYLIIILIPTVAFVVYAAVRAYKKSDNPKKRENLKVMLITGGILAAFFALMQLIL